ncbi:MAG TPA: Killer protein [Sutterella sp.]|nr:Killer protein [Sutterella sp.]
MIKSFLHKGLQVFFETGSAFGIPAKHAKKIALRLQLLDEAENIQQLNLHSLRLHQLKGERSGIWSVRVTGNWRITFKFENGTAYILNYEGYH